MYRKSLYHWKRIHLRAWFGVETFSFKENGILKIYEQAFHLSYAEHSFLFQFITRILHIRINELQDLTRLTFILFLLLILPKMSTARLANNG